jgi:putative transposase
LNAPADLVNRQFTATRPDELRCTDITEHPARDGKVYCCAILDCFSRMMVARTFSTTADTTLVNNAVNMAVANRNRRGATILHADHGTQFTSWSFGENIRHWGLLASFGTVGDCLITPRWSRFGPGSKSNCSTRVNGRPPPRWSARAAG